MHVQAALRLKELAFGFSPGPTTNLIIHFQEPKARRTSYSISAANGPKESKSQANTSKYATRDALNLQDEKGREESKRDDLLMTHNYDAKMKGESVLGGARLRLVLAF